MVTKQNVSGLLKNKTVLNIMYRRSGILLISTLLNKTMATAQYQSITGTVQCVPANPSQMEQLLQGANSCTPTAPPMDASMYPQQFGDQTGLNPLNQANQQHPAEPAKGPCYATTSIECGPTSGPVIDGGSMNGSGSPNSDQSQAQQPTYCTPMSPGQQNMPYPGQQQGAQTPVYCPPAMNGPQMLPYPPSTNGQSSNSTPFTPAGFLTPATPSFPTQQPGMSTMPSPLLQQNGMGASPCIGGFNDCVNKAYHYKQPTSTVGPFEIPTSPYFQPTIEVSNCKTNCKDTK
ncbi:hypothetical protein NUSPORA_00835 [Nucleospora cyclopteri]